MKNQVLNKTVKNLFNTLGAEDILTEENGEWILEGKAMPKETARLLISEAQTFLNTKLWKILRDDVKYKANKLMFEKSKTEMDLVAGKLWLYTLDCFKTRLESLAKGNGVFNDK